MPSDWGYWSSSTAFGYDNILQAFQRIVDDYFDELELEEEPKEKQLGFFDE